MARRDFMKMFQAYLWVLCMNLYYLGQKTEEDAWQSNSINEENLIETIKMHFSVYF